MDILDPYESKRMRESDYQAFRDVSEELVQDSVETADKGNCKNLDDICRFVLSFFDHEDHTSLLRRDPDLDLGNIQENWSNNNRNIFSTVYYTNIQVINSMASRKII